MGAIAIWCMHFIGNRGLVLGNGAKEIQIAYDSGYTVLSFFVPIVVLLAAFFAIGSNEKVRRLRVIVGGTMAGLAICGMHYLGQTGIANYDCVYNIPSIVGSVVVAIAASVIALWVFFVLRAGWTNSWWKRALCAFILSGASSGMHWVAAAGTSYRFKSAKATYDAPLSRNQVVIIVIVLVGLFLFSRICADTPCLGCCWMRFTAHSGYHGPSSKKDVSKQSPTGGLGLRNFRLPWAAPGHFGRPFAESEDHQLLC